MCVRLLVCLQLINTETTEPISELLTMKRLLVISTHYITAWRETTHSTSDLAYLGRFTGFLALFTMLVMLPRFSYTHGNKAWRYVPTYLWQTVNVQEAKRERNHYKIPTWTCYLGLFDIPLVVCVTRKKFVISICCVRFIMFTTWNCN